MKLFNLSRNLVTKVDDDVHEWIIGLGYKWYCSASGYAVRIHGRENRVVWTLHRLIIDCPDGMEVDHIDGDKLNNQRSNLRICNKTQQQGNRNGSRKTGFKGTIYRGRNRYRKWEAYITKKGKVETLGSFSSEVDAAKAYNVAATEHFGEFARLNKV